MNWRAGVSADIYSQRAEFLRLIREFFYQRQVLEVDTPALSPAASTDPALESFTCDAEATHLKHSLYLHTSPEFHMKRLLADGLENIYQVSKVFRREERGRWHQPEFVMLEWYRTGMTWHELMRELAELVCLLAGSVGLNPEVETRSYQELFAACVDLDPHTADVADLRMLVDADKYSTQSGGADLLETADRDLLLQILMSDRIEPGLPKDKLTLVYDYPAGQAALARLRPESSFTVAERFELYWGDLELANGFQELTAADEQQQRFEQDLATRKRNGQKIYPPDVKLIEALRHGLPECSGVAVGLDRLFAKLLGKNNLTEVTGFTEDI